ncbi:MAG: hypothetical protein GXY48_08500 [Methanomicrobiales archaeon]|nr:hypothetical protein [Methanomicrobiales archaeon]
MWLPIELAKHGLITDDYLVTGLIAVLAVPFDLAIGFCAGLILAWILIYRKEHLKT